MLYGELHTLHPDTYHYHLVSTFGRDSKMFVFSGRLSCLPFLQIWHQIFFETLSQSFLLDGKANLTHQEVRFRR